MDGWLRPTARLLRRLGLNEVLALAARHRPTSEFDIFVSSLNDGLSVDLVVVCFLPNVAPFCALQVCCEGVQMVGCNRTDFRPIAQLGFHHLPSFLSGVVFLHEACAVAA